MSPLPLSSPSNPAIVLLTGVYLLTVTLHLLDSKQPPHLLGALYFTAASWVMAILWRRRYILQPLTWIDLLFGCFVVHVVANLLSSYHSSLESLYPHIRLVLLLMVTPYLCGRAILRTDLSWLLRTLVLAGLAILPLLVIDRITSPHDNVSRWPFFGIDASPILIGGLLAIAMLGCCINYLDHATKPTVAGRSSVKIWMFFSLSIIFTTFLVWVTARGWLLAGAFAAVLSCLFARNRLSSVRLTLALSIFLTIATSLSILPMVDNEFRRLYAEPLRLSLTEMDDISAYGPILGESSCTPVQENRDSISIRLLMYREGMAMLAQKPGLGVGATHFGEHS